ncbi:MAG: hypothetical protein ABWZ25_11640 [Chitinophagaceae bacterium]
MDIVTSERMALSSKLPGSWVPLNCRIDSGSNWIFSPLDKFNSNIVIGLPDI